MTENWNELLLWLGKRKGKNKKRFPPRISPLKINEPDLNSRLNEDDEASAKEILLVISCSF